MGKAIHITGTAGTGKTAVSNELIKHGVKVFDMGSVPGLCVWKNRQTDEVVKYPEQAGQDWVDAHKRVCDVDKLKQLINEQDKLTVITGLAKGNQDEYLKIFDKIFLLQCSPEVLLERLKTRTTNVYAKTPEEQKTTLQNQKLFDSSMIKKGAIPIDNSKDSVSETALHLISQF